MSETSSPEIDSGVMAKFIHQQAGPMPGKPNRKPRVHLLISNHDIFKAGIKSNSIIIITDYVPVVGWKRLWTRAHYAGIFVQTPKTSRNNKSRILNQNMQNMQNWNLRPTL